MFGTQSRGANAYAAVGIETGVTSASPHKLIVMLFDGALAAITTASFEMRAKNIAGKGQAISKAISIIENGLRASLNKNVGGQIAISLDALYEYMSKQLLSANLTNSEEILEQVKALLLDLKGAWVAIGKEPDSPTADELAVPARQTNFATY